MVEQPLQILIINLWFYIIGYILCYYLLISGGGGRIGGIGGAGIIIIGGWPVRIEGCGGIAKLI